MELDALQQRWQMQDARLDEMLTLNRRLLGSLERGHARTALQGVARTLWTQFAIDALAVFGLGVFIGNRLGSFTAELRFLAPAIALFLPAIAVFASVIWQLAQLAGIDAAGPVTVMQRRLERLRARRVQIAKTIILTATVLWVPVYIVGLRALFGFDAYAWFPVWFLVLNVAIGATMVPIFIVVARRFGPRLTRFPAVEHFNRHLAGGAFAEAMEQLGRLEEFERDEDA